MLRAKESLIVGCVNVSFNLGAIGRPGLLRHELNDSFIHSFIQSLIQSLASSMRPPSAYFA